MGGVKWAYITAKLLAAAVWKQHLEADPLHPGVGRWLRDVLFSVGASAPAHHVLTELLGPEALVACDIGGGSVDGNDGPAGSQRVVTAWVPDLAAEVFQDVDLLG